MTRFEDAAHCRCWILSVTTMDDLRSPFASEQVCLIAFRCLSLLSRFESEPVALHVSQASGWLPQVIFRCSFLTTCRLTVAAVSTCQPTGMIQNVAT